MPCLVYKLVIIYNKLKRLKMGPLFQQWGEARHECMQSNKCTTETILSACSLGCDDMVCSYAHTILCTLWLSRHGYNGACLFK